MTNLRTIHVVPQTDGRWEVRVHGGQSTLIFADLGCALDAATGIPPAGITTRVVVHEPVAA